ncbi:hypothetical protein EDB83DRAFT_2511955 [Lactarius deliciosus]|nr:hypothetical protein EDB83DRAFT_2511955 [Lactarius deliciosus]
MAQQPQPQVPTYGVNIPTIHEFNPELPEVLGNVDLNHPIHANDPINPQDRAHARSVATALKATHDFGLDARVTAAVVEYTELRAFAVESACM